jgi:hypothetical protein
MDWYIWRMEHERVQFTGLKIGEAISDLLESFAYNRASEYWARASKGERQTYNPAMGLEQIQEELEKGGYEFRSTSALREVNASLINSLDVRKERHFFKHARADEILKEMRPNEADSDAPKQDDDDVPF